MWTLLLKSRKRELKISSGVRGRLVSVLIEVAKLIFWAEPQALNGAVYKQKAEVKLFNVADDQNMTFNSLAFTPTP